MPRRKYKYNTLPELIAAYKSGELSGDDILWIDNDDAFIYTGDGDEDDKECVFRMEPWQIIWDALDILGIPHEGV